MTKSPKDELMLTVIDADGNATEKQLALPEAVLATEPNYYLLKRVVIDHQINRAQGNRSTLLRSEVRGGGRKPWRQKGTGRARHGSIRSPIWRGGGVAFAPKPNDRSQALSRRERRAAFVQALAFKAGRSAIAAADPMDLGDGKTKSRAAWIKNAGLAGRVLLVDFNPPDSLLRSAANIPNVTVTRADTLSAYDVLAAKHLIFSPDALAALGERGLA